jgi:uncharacterized peroxidase-related enzyme
MPFFSNLDDDSVVPDIAVMTPEFGKTMGPFHKSIMESPSELDRGQRELIAAYVSGLNSCDYCYGVHTLTAAAFGIEETLFDALMSDPDGAPIDEKMKPLLRLARRLTLEPAKVVQSDIDAITGAGWKEQTAHDAILVCCMFNFMNRLLDGHGVKGNPEMYRARVKILADPAAYESGHHRKNV